MYRWLKRITGLCVVGFVVLLAGWGTVKLYDQMYSGDPHYVVMQEGTAGTKPGSSVYYEGMQVGEVSETQPLVHSTPETQRRANSSYLRKFYLLQDVEGLTPRKRNPHRKALVKFLLREPSIPIGSSTYATGSAFYVTGQGYITLKNRGLTARGSTEPVYIPSTVKYPWLEQYVNMALSVAPFLEHISSFHTRLQNWYDDPDKSGRRDTVSGREQIDALPEYIDTMQSGTDSLSAGLDTFGGAVSAWNRKVETSIRQIPHTKASAMDHTLYKSIRTLDQIHDGKTLFRPASLHSIQSLRRSVDGFNRSLQSIDDALNDADSDLFRNGILD
jgi:hypothetical protein